MHTLCKAGLLLFALVTQAVWADQPPVKLEAEKAERIKSILQKHPLIFSAEYSYGTVFHPDQPEAERLRLLNSIKYKKETSAFCDAFYTAMQRADKSIRYIEPKVRTDDPNHPGLERYHSCSDAELRPNFSGRWAGMYDDIDQIGHRAFRLYRLDLDGNPKNGLEEYLYAELDWERSSQAHASGYHRVDLKRCEHAGADTIVQQSDAPGQTWFKDNYNALIHYREQYYIFDLYDLRGQVDSAPVYRLELYSYLPKQRAFNRGRTCTWKFH